MSDVCVVTGGGNGMGLSAALQMPKDKIIIVSGRTISKLEKAVEQRASLSGMHRSVLLSMGRKESVCAL